MKKVNQSRNIFSLVAIMLLTLFVKGGALMTAGKAEQIGREQSQYEFFGVGGEPIDFKEVGFSYENLVEAVNAPGMV